MSIVPDYGPNYRGDTDQRAFEYGSVSLDNGCRLAWALHSNGATTAWIIDPGSEHSNTAGHRVPHEQLGPLPDLYAYRVRNVAPVNPLPHARCDAPTKQGNPCRNLVCTPGIPCWQHRGRS